MYKRNSSDETTVANCSGTMEVDTISKNGRSSKSHTSRGDFRLIMCVLILPIVLFSSCLTSKVLDFSIVSTKNVDMSKASSYKVGNQSVTGQDMAHIIIFIPTKSMSINKAVDKAIENVPGCVALLDGVIYRKIKWIPNIYGKGAAIVEGTPLIDPNIVQYQTNGITTFCKIELDKQGEIKNVENITIGEYIALKNTITKDTKCRRNEQ